MGRWVWVALVGLARAANVSVDVEQWGYLGRTRTAGYLTLAGTGCSFLGTYEARSVADLTVLARGANTGYVATQAFEFLVDLVNAPPACGVELNGTAGFGRYALAVRTVDTGSEAPPLDFVERDIDALVLQKPEVQFLPWSGADADYLARVEAAAHPVVTPSITSMPSVSPVAAA